MPIVYDPSTYLTNDYLVDPYLDTTGLLAHGSGFQTLFVKNGTKSKGFQTFFVANGNKSKGFQTFFIANGTKDKGFQVEFVSSKFVGFQSEFVIYNNTQLRILSEFASRGTPALGGNNWTTTSQASGDFLPKNLNTDIEEQVFRSAANSVTLTCDTGITQGTTIDTLAIRNHNLTTSAIVQLQGANNPGFAPIAVSINIVSTKEHAYYIAPVFPTGILNKNRYWRLVIQDSSLSYVQIGAIIFGNADVLFTRTENYDNPLRFSYQHFKDSMQNEGFTAISNDRSLKRNLKLSFSDIERIKNNFSDIQAYVESVRTSLKALVIPMPIDPGRYAVFAKLTNMPEYEVRNVNDLDDASGEAEYISFSLDWDESN